MDPVITESEKIVQASMLIAGEFPELTTYLNEMPVNITGEKSQEINEKELKDYGDSLTSLINKYAISHEPIQNKHNQ